MKVNYILQWMEKNKTIIIQVLAFWSIFRNAQNNISIEGGGERNEHLGTIDVSFSMCNYVITICHYRIFCNVRHTMQVSA